MIAMSKIMHVHCCNPLTMCMIMNILVQLHYHVQHVQAHVRHFLLVLLADCVNLLFCSACCEIMLAYKRTACPPQTLIIYSLPHKSSTVLGAWLVQ